MDILQIQDLMIALSLTKDTKEYKKSVKSNIILFSHLYGAAIYIDLTANNSQDKSSISIFIHNFAEKGKDIAQFKILA